MTTIKVVRGKTIRATMINLLLKNKGKKVSFLTVKTAAAKATGLKPETVASRLKNRTSLVNRWAADHKMKLVVAKDSLQLLAGK